MSEIELINCNFNFIAMRKFVLLIILSIAAIVKLQAQSAKYLPGTVVVKYSNSKSAANRSFQFEDISNAKVRHAARMFQTKKQDRNSAELSNIFRIEYEGNTSPIVIARKLSQIEGIEYAEPYWIPELFDTPDDPLISNQYYLDITKTLEVQDITQGDTNIVIGIIDTGFDVYHEDLTGSIKYNYSDPINGIDDDGDGYIDNYRGWDMANNDNNPSNPSSQHGTHVAGVACAQNGNGTGIAGVGGKTKFLPIKIADDESGNLTAGYEGVVYAADHGCRIINCSWGSTAPSQMCDDVIKYAQSRGCLVVAAAGNTGTDVKYYPASCDGVISVCATNSTDTKWNNSTYNHRIDVAAPGEGIYSTANGNKYQSSSGSSFAAPIVSAAAALVWAKKTNFSAAKIGELLRTTADIIDTIPANAKYAGMMGSGRINILRALTDNTSPSIRITDYSFTGDNDEFVAGSKVDVELTLCNYLEMAQNVKITLEFPDGSAIITNGSWETASIASMEHPKCSFSAILADQLPYNAIIPFRFTFSADGYTSAQTIELLANPAFRDIKWGEMLSTIADNGKIGIYDYDAQSGNGFTYQKTQNLVSDGALILALDSLTIASAFQTDNQFVSTTGRPTIQTIDNVTYIKSAIKPTNTNGIEILQDFIFDDQNLPTTMICKYQIISTRDDSFDNACIGLYFDWDVVNSLTNKIEYDSKRRLAYIYNTGDIGLYGGICLLTEGQATPYAFEIGDKSRSINIKDDFSDGLKWAAMNQPRPESTTSNIDLALMLTSNRLNITSNDTSVIVFAVLAAENLYELNRAADLAKKLYTKRESTVIDDDTTAISNQRQTTALIYPNPAKSTIYIENNSPISTVRIYSTSGVLEAETNVCGTSAAIGVSQLANGLHIVEIISTDGRTERRLVVK
jgi:subtilisin family serine protease